MAKQKAKMPKNWRMPPIEDSQNLQNLARNCPGLLSRSACVVPKPDRASQRQKAAASNQPSNRKPHGHAWVCAVTAVTAGAEAATSNWSCSALAC